MTENKNTKDLEHTGYAVILHNDASLKKMGRGGGFVHTWLEIIRPGKEPVLISFQAGESILIGDEPGAFDLPGAMDNRENRSITIAISQKQAEDMLAEHAKYREAPPSYDLGPDHDGDYNCTTYSNMILQAGGIHYLKDIQTPYGVEAKMLNEIPELPRTGIILDKFVEASFDGKDKLDDVLLETEYRVNNLVESASDFITRKESDLSSLEQELKQEVAKFEKYNQTGRGSDHGLTEATAANIARIQLAIELLKVDRDILASQESWNKTEADLADDGWLDLSNFLQNGGASSDEDFNIFDDFDFGSDLHLNGNENDNTDWESKLDNSTNPFAGSIFPDGFNFGSNLHLNDSSDNGYSGIDWDSAGSGFLDNILSGHINKDGYWINPDGTQSILLADTGDGMQFLPGSFFGQSAGESAAETAEDDSGWNIRLDNSKDPFDLSRLWSNVRVNNSGDNTGGWQIGLNGSSEKGSAGTGLADIGSPAGKESAEVSASSGLTTESTAATQNNAAMDSSEASVNTSSGESSSIFDISGLWSNMHLNGSDNNGYSGIDWNAGDSGDNENPLLSSLKEGLSLTPEESAGSGSLLSDTSAGRSVAEIPASSSRELEHNLAAANSIKEYYNSIHNLSEAFENGTVFDKGGSVLEHLSAGVEAGKYFNEGSGGSSSASDSFSSTAGANLDAAASAFGLAGAIDSGDGLAIARSGLELVTSIDRALDIEAKFDDKLQTTSDTAGLSDNAAKGLGIAMSGLDLAMSLEDGDGLAIAASGVSLAKNISGASAGSGLGVLGSGLSLAQDIDGLDDAFSSGDAKTIAQATMNTAYDAVSLYNSASAMAGFSQVGASNLPAIGAAIGVAQGVMRAFDGDVAGGAVDAGVAVASCYLMTIPVWGWAAAAVLNIANALFNTSEPPKGHADFSIENGVVDFAVSGDSEMEGQTSGMAEAIRGTMQSYINGGGRVAIEGEKMLTLSTESGATPHLDYGSIGGGNIRVNLDPDDLGGSLLGVLVARDRGADLSMAIRQSQLPGGGIDIAHVDAVMAGLGYVKDGINYVYGERTEVYLSAVGTGVFAGGHNVGGPEGEVIVARQSDVTVHPPRENQLPQRTIGKVIENIDVGSNLLGAGSSLFAAALMGVGLGRNQANAAEFTPSIANREGSLPLDAATAAAYRRGDWLPADGEKEQENGTVESSADSDTAVEAATIYTADMPETLGRILALDILVGAADDFIMNLQQQAA